MPQFEHVVADARTRRQDLASEAATRTWTLGADAFIAIAVVLGCVVRIVQYASNRSLWLDESALALNIIDRSAGGLFHSLAFNQASPPGFLLVEKASTELFGRGEYALRLFPLLCSLAALPLFALIARRILGRWSAALATLLFASAGGLVYYGSEVKQYSSDVTGTLVLLLIGLSLYERPGAGWRRAAGYALAGCVVVSISYAAVFPALAIAAVLVIRDVMRPPRVTPTLLVAGAWGLASLLVVLFSRHTATNVQIAFVATPGAYVSASSSGLSASLREVPSALARDISVLPLASPIYWTYVAVAVLGCAALVRRRIVYAGFFVGAMALTLVGSALHRYPIADRTILFFVPVALVLFAEGIAVIVGAARRWSFRPVLAAVLALAALAVPGWRALSHLAHPQKHEEIKAAFSVLRAGWKPGDTLYVSYPTQFALRYYLDCDCVATPPWPFGRTNARGGKETVPLRSHLPDLVAGMAPGGGQATYATEAEKLRGRPRVWLLYTHMSSKDSTFLREELPRKLSAIGRQRLVFTAPGVLLFGYDLR